MLNLLLPVLGLVVFEIITSVDNAVINAEVVSKMSERGKRWFLLWGLLFAVFVVRGLLPFLIVLLTNPSIDFSHMLSATLSGDREVANLMAKSAPLLLTGGGVFLVFLFAHWLFTEPKNYGLSIEPFFHAQGVWFYATVSVFLAIVTWFALQINPLMAFSAVAGSTAFFLTHGFKNYAEEKERELLQQNSGISDLSKILYLEVIDTTFSIDSVVGAFAFTLSVPLILVGNGLGAYIVRDLTVKNIENVKKYLFLKNGAMYSIFFLGLIMLFDSFGLYIPSWISPVVTFALLGFFFWKSHKHLNGKNINST